MPRTLKISTADLQRARRDWYAFHYEKRQKFQALSINAKHIYENATMRVNPPQMTIYGGLPENWVSREEMQMLMQIQGMQDTDLCCPWYVSDYGWEQFQELWKALPEPVELSTGTCVQSYPLVHTVHNPRELSPSRRA